MQCDENDKQLEDALDAVAGAYKWICLKQSNAVNDLSIDAGQKDPPSFWESALWACADVALALALGGVGGLVAAKVLKKLAEAGIPDLTAKIVADGVKDASKATAKSLLGGMKHGASTKNQRELFFRSQRDVLQDTAKMDEEEFIVSGKHKIRQAKQPYTSEAGVLGIVIRVDRPGAKPKVERAEIEGLNEGLRSLIENRRGGLRSPSRSALAKPSGSDPVAMLPRLRRSITSPVGLSLSWRGALRIRTFCCRCWSPARKSDRAAGCSCPNRKPVQSAQRCCSPWARRLAARGL